MLLLMFDLFDVFVMCVAVVVAAACAALLLCVLCCVLLMKEFFCFKIWGSQQRREGGKSG